jgi:HNH endonuclease/Helix-turn-helix domain
MECIEWSGARSSAGYGQKWRDGKLRYVHREAWEKAYGTIPVGMLVMHVCDNPACYRLDHLRLGTQKDNMADASAKGRCRPRALSSDESYRMIEAARAKGKLGGWHRLTLEQVAQVRTLREMGWTQTAIAERFGMSQATISNIIRRRLDYTR